MFKNFKNLNFKLINTLILVIIIFLIYQMRGLWGGIINTIFSIITPFIIGFTIAYVLYPVTKKLERRIPKVLAIFIVSLLMLLFLGLILWLFIPNILPILFDQTSSLFSGLIKFIQDISNKFDVNLGGLKDNLADMANQLTSGLGKTISEGALSFINQSINILSKTLIAMISSIYFLFEMDGIRIGVRSFFRRRNAKTFEYVRALDIALRQYFRGLSLVILFQLVEYTLVFYLIGHPNYLLLGILSAVTTIIPYFGALVTNIIAVITAAVINSKLLILTIAVSLILPNTDGNIVSPKIFKQTNQIPALLTIFAVFAGGVLYGFVGIIVSLPVTVILLTTYRFYKDDINVQIDKMKKKSSKRKVEEIK